jgi:hypothetical protein
MSASDYTRNFTEICIQQVLYKLHPMFFFVQIIIRPYVVLLVCDKKKTF